MHAYGGEVLQAMFQCSVPGCDAVIRVLIPTQSRMDDARGFLCYHCKLKMQGDELERKGVWRDEAIRDE